MLFRLTPITRDLKVEFNSLQNSEQYQSYHVRSAQKEKCIGIRNNVKTSFCKKGLLEVEVIGKNKWGVY